MTAAAAAAATAWIAVADRLPEHGQTVLVWCDSVEIATFKRHHAAWDDGRTFEDHVQQHRAVMLAHGFEPESEERLRELFDGRLREPYFVGGDGGCVTTWRQSNGFATDEEEDSYGWRPPITHWMPLPEPP